jgi:hypothetical protein
MLGVVSPKVVVVVVAPAFTWLFTFIPYTSLSGREARASRQAAGERHMFSRIRALYMSRAVGAIDAEGVHPPGGTLFLG